MSQWGLAKSYRAYMRQRATEKSGERRAVADDRDVPSVGTHDRAREDVPAYTEEWPRSTARTERQIRYTYPSPYGQEARTQLPLFEDETGISVLEQHTPPTSIGTLEAYRELYQEGEPEFDVGHIDIVWPGEFHSNGWAEPLDDRQGHTDEMLDIVIDTLTVDGDLVAMPLYTDVNVLYYHETKLQEHGYDEPPATEGELIEIASEIVQRDDDVEHGYLWQGGPQEGLTVMWFNWLWSRGGTVWNNDEIILDTEEGIDALRHGVELIHEHQVTPTSITDTHAHDNRATFQEGRSLFMRHWPKAVALMADNTPVAGDFSVTTLPAQKNHLDADRACLGGWNVFISSASSSRTTAQEFVDWTASEDVQRRLALDYTRLPVRRSLYEDPDVQEAFHGELDVFKRALESARSRPPVEGYSTLSKIIQTECNAALERRKTPAEALIDAQRKVDLDLINSVNP